MMSLIPGIKVNGVHITADQIGAEVQYHPAESLSEARHGAMQALVIKELLLQRAIDLGIYDVTDIGRDTDSVIEEVLEAEIKVPELDNESCFRYYTNNKTKFMTSPLFQVSHILFLAPPEHKEAYDAARQEAERTIEILRAHPEQFADIAKRVSKCSSASSGGQLGQITKGQTMPDFERALLKMEQGELYAVPVASEVGYHIIKVHHRVDGEQLPYDSVKSRISEFLEEQSWNRAFSQYIQLLAGKADISGFRLKQTDDPLVQ
jgi:peptidyl-prolyl cis-trans isomerase C